MVSSRHETGLQNRVFHLNNLQHQDIHRLTHSEAISDKFVAVKRGAVAEDHYQDCLNKSDHLKSCWRFTCHVLHASQHRRAQLCR